MADFSFSRRLRLLTSDDFQRVFRDPCRSVDACLTVLAATNGLPYPRLGLAISKRYVRTAVARNRVKRIIRNSFRLHQDGLSGLDIVVLSRSGTGSKSAPELHASLTRHWQRIKHRCKNC